jgi:hypothetical protein
MRGPGGRRRGWRVRGEKTQTLYAHMNKKIKKYMVLKKKNLF